MLFNTLRTQVISAQQYQQLAKTNIADQIIQTLSSEVVQSLPDNFQDIVTRQQALTWLEQMQAEAEVLVILNNTDDCLMGFIFLYPAIIDKDVIKQVHLGYLLAYQFWRQGFASEVLGQCMSWLGESCRVEQVFAGVSAENVASKQLLLKLGFRAPGHDLDLYLFEIKPN